MLGESETELGPALLPRLPRSTQVRATAVHGNAMLSRLTAQIGQHDINSFSYSMIDDEYVEVLVGVQGDQWQVNRVVSRLRRIIGVIDAVVEPGNHDSAPKTQSTAGRKAHVGAQSTYSTKPITKPASSP